MRTRMRSTRRSSSRTTADLGAKPGEVIAWGKAKAQKRATRWGEPKQHPSARTRCSTAGDRATTEAAEDPQEPARAQASSTRCTPAKELDADRLAMARMRSRRPARTRARALPRRGKGDEEGAEMRKARRSSIAPRRASSRDRHGPTGSIADDARKEAGHEDRRRPRSSFHSQRIPRLRVEGA